jgi:hypothetical protein
MSITLRQATQRAGGGEIVRTRDFPTEEVVIGRGADCDIELHDLAVSLRHAVLRQTGPGRVLVESLGNQPFGVNGRYVTKADLKVGDRPKLVFGDQVLTLEPGQSAGNIVLHLAAATGASDREAINDEVAVFTPRARLLSKRVVAWTLGIALILVCLAAQILAFYGGLTVPDAFQARIDTDHQWSSGPLSRSHAFLETDCKACHQKAFVAIRDEACLTCHQAQRPKTELAASAARIRAAGSAWTPRLVRDHADHDRLLKSAPLPDDLRGKVTTIVERAFNHGQERCAGCHREHVSGGVDPATGAITTPLPEKPTLVAAFECADCHNGLKGRLRDSTLPDTPDWTRHPDFRPLVTVSAGPKPRVERVALSMRPRENSGLTFPHRLHLAPYGSVARMAQVLGPRRGYGAALDCASCHRPDAGGKSFKPVEMERDCGDCHSLAFSRQGGQLRLLPHGKPAEVVAWLRTFYGSGDAAGPRAAPPARRRPGATDGEKLTAARWDGRTGAGGHVAGGVRIAFGPGGLCWDCHKIIPPAIPGSLDYQVAPVRLSSRFLPRGAFDHGIDEHSKTPTGGAACADCHKAALSDTANDLMLPSITACAACHGKTKAQTARAASGECAECHSYHAPGVPARKPAKPGVAAALPPQAERVGRVRRLRRRASRRRPS